jgi:hypothetical protein
MRKGKTMGEMKSAWEKAMEKAEALGKPSEEELRKLEFIPAGNTLAAKYLQAGTFNLEIELAKYKDIGAKPFIMQGAQEIFIRNISLPHDEHDKNMLQKAMTGIKVLKENKKQVDVVIEQINTLVTYYEQARQQAFLQFKKNFEGKIQEMGQSFQQRAKKGVSLEAQIQLQFQEEWRRASSELDTQYEKALEEQRQKIVKIT